MLFDIDNTERAGWTVLRPSGDVDLASAPRVRSMLLRAGSGDLAIDIAAVDLIDSVGLGLLIGARRRAHQVGARFVLCGRSPLVDRLLAETGLETLFERADDVDTAIGGRS